MIGTPASMLDLMMPEMSGIEVLAHLHRDRPTLRVVIMSGNEDVEVARATLRVETGPEGAVTRPMRPCGDAPAPASAPSPCVRLLLPG